MSFQPLKALPFGALSGTFVGVVSEEIGAGIAVFVLTSLIGFLLTLIEHLTGFRQVVIDFEAKKLKAQNTIFRFSVHSLNVENLDIDKFCLSVKEPDKKMFRKYWLEYAHEGKLVRLVLVPGKDSKQELTEIFQKHGTSLPLKTKKLGKYVIAE